MKLHVFFSLLIITVLGTFLFEQKLKNDWLEKRNIEIEQEANLLSLQMADMFNASFSNLAGLASLFEIHPKTNEEEFVQFAKVMRGYQPAIRAIQFADKKTQIIYIYPKKGNEVILEKPFVLLTDKIRGEITRRAIETRTLTIQEPFILKQGGVGTVARIPIFKEGVFIGLALGVYDINMLLDFLVPKDKREKFAIHFTDQSNNTFYTTGELTEPYSNAPIDIGNNFWKLSLSWKVPPQPPLVLRHGIIYVITGTLLILILFLLNKTWVYTELLNKTVKIHTKDLQDANSSLKREVIQRNKVTEQLSQNEEKLRALINTTIDGVISFDTDLKVSLWNPAAQKIYGYSQKEILGESFLSLVPERYQKIEQERWKEFKDTGSGPSIGKTLEIICLRKDGQELPIELSFSTHKVNGRDTATAIVRNIAKRKEHERLLLETEKNLHQEVDHLKKQLDEKIELRKKMGESKEILKVINQIKLVAPTMMNVIIQGESGTGKEIMANMIHQNSDRKEAPFVAVDCGAIPETLFESELFGHERGAFTGADKTKIGKFEMAKGGTLFLDELTNLSFDSQGKLLRVIQERKYYRVGGKESKELDVRIIVATNRVMAECVSKGEFRDDLFHRLNQFSVALPTLKDRRDDIPFLISEFIDEANREFKKTVQSVSRDGLKVLMNYTWPGNIRELNNVIKRAVLLSSSDEITADILELDSYTTGEGTGAFQTENVIDKIIENELSFQEASKINTEKFDKEIIQKVLSRVGDKKTKAAEILGLNRKTLYTKLKKLNIEK